MKKTVVFVKGMDCASEERIIRMKLAGKTSVHQLKIDLTEQIVEIFHDDEEQQIVSWLDELDLGSQLLSSQKVSAVSVVEDSANSHLEKRILCLILGINFLFFCLEMAYGYLADTMSLVADGMDMLADSLVYGLALVAVGRHQSFKQKITSLAAYFQLILAFGGLIQVLLRFIHLDYLPDVKQMVLISSLALLGNGLCLWLLNQQSSSEIHMKASQIFTSNDILINLGVILTGILVYFTQSPLPDLLVGIAIFIMVTRGGIRILRLSND